MTTTPMDDARAALAKLDARLERFNIDTLGDDPAEFDAWLKLKDARDSLAAAMVAS